MNASMMNRIENAQFALILMSTTKLTDDRTRALRPPIAPKPATATIAEILAAKEVN